MGQLCASSGFRVRYGLRRTDPSISHCLKSVFSHKGDFFLPFVVFHTSLESFVLRLGAKMDTLPSATLFLCGRWWLITDCGFSSLFHSCLIMSGACWGPNYSYAICFPLSAEQCGNVNWSVYLFIAFQDVICPRRNDGPCVTYRLNFKRGWLQNDSLFLTQWRLFSHQCCLSGPWGCPVFD